MEFYEIGQDSSDRSPLWHWYVSDLLLNNFFVMLHLISLIVMLNGNSVYDLSNTFRNHNA